MRFPKLTVLAVLTIFSLAACSGSPATPTAAAVRTAAPIPTVAPIPSSGATAQVATGLATATVKGTITLSGTYYKGSLAGSADFTETVSSIARGGNACTDFAQYGGSLEGNGFAMTAPPVTIGGHKIILNVSPFAAYHGPGSYNYPAGDTSLSTGSLVGVDVDDGQDDFADPGTGTASLTVKADGSGTATFAGLTDENGGDGTIGGSVSWTCG